MIRCSICALSTEQQEALAQALRAGVSLQAIFDKTDLTKSSIWRHSRRLDRADAQAKQNAMAPSPSTVPAAAPATMPAPQEQPTAVVPTTTKELDQPVSNIVPAKPRSREDTLANSITCGEKRSMASRHRKSPSSSRKPMGLKLRFPAT